MNTAKQPGALDPSATQQQKDSSVAHHPPAPRQQPTKPLRPGAKGQRGPMARPRVAARQRGPR